MQVLSGSLWLVVSCAWAIPAVAQVDAATTSGTLPELLLRIDEPAGRLKTFAALAKLGASAHAALFGFMRVPKHGVPAGFPVPPEGAVPADFADAFGEIEKAGWAVPILIEVLPRRDARPVALELLRRLGPRAAAARPAIEALGVPPEDDLARLRAAALAAIGDGGRVEAGRVEGAEVAKEPPAPSPGDAGAAADAHPDAVSWPSLAAVLAGGDPARAVDALEAILRAWARNGPDRLQAEGLLRTLHWTMRARLLLVRIDCEAVQGAGRVAAMQNAALAGLPSHCLSGSNAWLSTKDLHELRLLALLVAGWPADELRRGSYSRQLARALPKELHGLRDALRPRLSAAEVAELLAAFRKAAAAPAGSPHTVLPSDAELDVVGPDLLPELLPMLSSHGSLAEFARRSLEHCTVECVPLLLQAVDEASDGQRHALYRVLGSMRPTTPDLVQSLLERAFDREQSAARDGLREADQDVVAAVVAERLSAPWPRAQLRYYARELRHPVVVAAVADLNRRALQVDPILVDEQGRTNLFYEFARLEGGFERLRELVRHPDRGVQHAALRVFGSKMFAKPGQVAALLPLLDSPDGEIAGEAARGLGNAAERQGEVAAVLEAKWAAAAPGLRAGFVEAFGGLGTAAASAVPLVEGALHDAAGRPQITAAWALLRMQPGHAPATAVLRAELAGDDVDRRVEALQWLRRDAALMPAFGDEILQNLAREEAPLQQHALFCLRQMDAAFAMRAAGRLRELTQSSEGRVSLWASVIAREKLGDK